MAKAKKAYVCNDCGSEHAKWQGQCSDCGEWNTLTEIILQPAGQSSGVALKNVGGYAGELESKVQALSEVSLEDLPRIASGIGEFDRVLGGGFVQGSAILIGGNPGAGKSTLLLEILCQLGEKYPALYVTGEESLQQVAMRAKRLQLPTKGLNIVSETDVHSVLRHANQLRPKILVIDSIQVMHIPEVPSSPGSVSQVRESAAFLTRFAKQTGTIVILVGHVTKDGALAGPKVLEHMIDTSILLEGTSDSRFRTLRGQKNRFGPVNELGVFAMLEQGLKEVKNPSAIFLSQSEAACSGSLVMVVWEGTRPLLVELQALVNESHFSNPSRVTVGVEQNRVAMLLAVLQRHGGIQANDQDVFVNVVGGVKIVETSADLAVLLAIVSSFKNIVLAKELIVFGEVGLSGEIRPVPSGQERLQEAAKHGFKRAIVPRANAPREPINGMDVLLVDTLAQAIDLL